jgi:hypothetical protein
MKNFLSICLLLLSITLSNTVFSQLKKPGITLGAGLYYANPQGSFKDEYKGGLGGEVKGGVGLGNTYLVATLGYAVFSARSDNEYGTLTYKPVKVGVKRYFLAKRIFVNSDLGVATLKDKSMNSSTRTFTKGFGGGARLLGLEASVYYDSWGNPHSSGTANSLQFKLGYNLTL